MEIDRFQGDPKVTLGPNGSNLVYRGGQPEMDQGFENYVMISLFTEEGWFGNHLFKKPEQKIGSKFVEANNRAITVPSLNEVRIMGEAALRAMVDTGLADVVGLNVTNPTGNSKRIEIHIIGATERVFVVSANGTNWKLQEAYPAHERVE